MSRNKLNRTIATFYEMKQTTKKEISSFWLHNARHCTGIPPFAQRSVTMPKKDLYCCNAFDHSHLAIVKVENDCF